VAYDLWTDRYHRVPNCCPRDDGGWWVFDPRLDGGIGEWVKLEETPTHWMPVPEPPESEREKLMRTVRDWHGTMDEMLARAAGRILGWTRIT